MPVNPQTAQIAFSHPIPGQSWATHAPRQAKWQHPPQFTKLDDAMNWLFDMLLEPMHYKSLMNLLEGGMSIEATARTILFTGFTEGKWTPTLMMLMFKPTMLMLIAMSHRAGLKDTPVVHPDSHKKYHRGKLAKHMTMLKAKQTQNEPFAEMQPPAPEQQNTPPPTTGGGFMQRTT